MFGFSKRRMRMGRVKVPLSETLPETRSPLRRSRRSSRSIIEDADATTENHTENQGHPCSTASVDVNVESETSESWMELSISGNKPTPRSHHAATVIGSKMIVVGGESGQGLLDDVQVLDFEQFSWATVSSKHSLSQHSLPLKIPACKGHCLITWGKKALLVGGKTEPAAEQISVWAFDIDTESWSLIEAKGDIPTARSGHSLVKASSALILFGGEDAKRRKLYDLHMFDLKSLTWLPLHCTGTGPTPRSSQVAALYQDKFLFVFGGASKSRILNDLYSLDFETMVWSRVKAGGHMPSPRSGCCGVLYDSKWYITGGGTRKKRHVDSFVYDITKMEWSLSFTSQPSSIKTNKGFSMVLVDHKERSFLVAFGGTKKEPSNQVEAICVGKNKKFDSLCEVPALSKSGEPALTVNRLSSVPLLGCNSSHPSFDSLLRGTLSSGSDRIGTGRRKSLSESLLAEPDEEQGFTGNLVKDVEDDRFPSSAIQADSANRKVASIARMLAEETSSSSCQGGSGKQSFHSHSVGILHQTHNTDEQLPDTHCAPGSAQASIYQVYESKIATLIRKNGILEGQLSAALMNQEAAEKSLSTLLKSRQEMERKFAGTYREMELLKEKLAELELAHDEANSVSNIVHSDNVRLEHDVAFLKAVLEDTQKELNSTRGVLAGERARAFQLQVEVFHAKQRLQTLEGRSQPTSRKPYQT